MVINALWIGGNLGLFDQAYPIAQYEHAAVSLAINGSFATCPTHGFSIEIIIVSVVVCF